MLQSSQYSYRSAVVQVHQALFEECLENRLLRYRNLTACRFNAATSCSSLFEGTADKRSIVSKASNSYQMAD